MAPDYTTTLLTDAEREMLADHVRDLYREASRQATADHGRPVTARVAASTEVRASELRDLIFRLGGSL